MNTCHGFVLGLILGLGCMTTQAADTLRPGEPLILREGWQLKSSVLVSDDDAKVSSVGYLPQEWLKTTVPSTVLNAMIKNDVYPDVRVGMNSFKIPDASEEFNRKNDLAKYSYLPDKRNPWKDPYWYRTEFRLPAWSDGGRVWLNFKGINYRAEVWLNGAKIADRKEMVGAYRRFRFDITAHARPGENCLAVKVFPVDHPGEPELQLEPLGKARSYIKEIQKDVTYTVAVGYDCMPPIPDRNMGIWQEVSVDFTGPVDIRDPFVVSRLPLPRLDSASLTISAELVNTTGSTQKGTCRGVVTELGRECVKEIELAPGETKTIVFSPSEFPQLEVANPRLWWPKPYGAQNLHHLRVVFETSQGTSAGQTVAFGIRQIGKELHHFNSDPGLRVLVNGKRVFCQGGWLQPELLFDWSGKRAETEVRYLTEANLNTVTFEDLPVPCDDFLEACDRHGLMYWTSFYGSYWVRPGTKLPEDRELLAQCAVDVIKGYRNHPSVILYSCSGEEDPSKEVYLTWRKNVLALDSTRLFIPSIDVHKPLEWLLQDIPTGVRDDHTFWDVEPVGYYHKVRSGGTWMFNTEVSIASLPPVAQLKRFLPDLLTESGVKPAPFPVDAVWAHHDATSYVKDYGPALRRLYGPVRNTEDYCWKSHLLTAERHRAWSEAVNHRMWDITSGVWQWKINSCWPSVGWQIYDWYLKPMVSYYYYKSAFEPLHVQLSPLDGMVTVVNRRLQPERGLEVAVKVFDSDMKMRWENAAKAEVGANTYRDVFSIPLIADLTTVYFVQLRMTRDGKPVSENFYWLSSRQPTDFSPLNRLPMAKVEMSQSFERRGDQTVAHVRLVNSGRGLAFFMSLVVTRGPGGDEVMPIFWDDNYFSLLPGQSKEINATFATEDLQGASPVVELGGWNIETPFECRNLKVSKAQVKPGQLMTVTAAIANTFLDGSPIELYVDDQPVDRQMFWARGKMSRELSFELKLDRPGSHQIRIGKQTAAVRVE